MYKILLIEDDEAICRELGRLLENHGYVSCKWNLKDDIKQVLAAESPDLILLDINLPHTDGFTLCTQIRSISKVPLIFVTSRDSDADELCSITLGGDDFIKKPYNASILLARIGALLKRVYESREAVLTHRGVTLDATLSRIHYRDKFEELTKNEVKILSLLFQRRGEIVSRDDLIDYLWDNKMFIDDNALSVNIARIRAKLKTLGVDSFIITRHRQGYCI